MKDKNDVIAIHNNPPRYKTLKSISERKQQLLTGIRADYGKMDALWKNLMKKKEQTSRGFRMANMLNTSAGIFDGAMLGWKLYRKYYGFLNKFKKDK